MKKRINTKEKLLLCILICVITALTGCQRGFKGKWWQEDAHFEETYNTEKVSYPGLDGPYDVEYVIDGDTIIVIKDEEKIHVRLIGIDTPESASHDENENTECGEAATNYTRSLLEGKSVYLEYDEELTDSYGRTLAYVYMSNDEGNMEMVNEILVRQGYAWTYPYYPNIKYKDVFEQAYLSSENNRHIPEKNS